MSLSVQFIGIPWYAKEHYAALRELFADGQDLPDTYGEWLQQAQGIATGLKRQGRVVVKAHIDPHRFPAWCAARGLDVNAHARLEWANEAARLKADDGFNH